MTDPPAGPSVGHAGAPAAPPSPEEQKCAACGAPLAVDQEWCLECGSARTAIQPPPDWRIGVAIVLGVVAIVVLVTIIVWP